MHGWLHSENIIPRVSKKLAAVIEKAMDTHPENRYQTALEMKKALLASIGEKVSDSKVFHDAYPHKRPGTKWKRIKNKESEKKTGYNSANLHAKPENRIYITKNDRGNCPCSIQLWLQLPA